MVAQVHAHEEPAYKPQEHAEPIPIGRPRHATLWQDNPDLTASLQFFFHRSGIALPACGGGAKKGLSAPHRVKAEALGRSRGGFSTKIHLWAEGIGKPMAILITPGQRNEQTVFAPLMETGAVTRAADKVGSPSGAKKAASSVSGPPRGSGTPHALQAKKTL